MFSPLWHHAPRLTLQKEAVASKATTEARASCQCKLEIMKMRMMVALAVSGDDVSEPTKIENFNIATLGMGNKRRLLPQRETASI